MRRILCPQLSTRDHRRERAPTTKARYLVSSTDSCSIQNELTTASRCKSNIVLIPSYADDIYSYFTQYHPLFPILDPNISPNDYYDQSPFLFWTIVVTGSRRYSDHPDVLEKTSQTITQLAFSSMALRTSQVPVIQGLLILCTWRLPTNSMYKDTTHLMCGSAVHLATQIGLHIAGVGQDFARTPLEKDQSLKIQRARLWLCCVIVSIRWVLEDTSHVFFS